MALKTVKWHQFQRHQRVQISIPCDSTDTNTLYSEYHTIKTEPNLLLTGSGSHITDDVHD